MSKDHIVGNYMSWLNFDKKFNSRCQPADLGHLAAPASVSGLPYTLFVVTKRSL